MSKKLSTIFNMQFSIFLFLSCILCLDAKVSMAQVYSGPESVEWIPGTHDYLVSNTNSGQILHRHGDGTLTLFVSGFTSGPHGLEIVGDTVYCCAGTHLKGYRVSSATSVFDVTFAGASFLNGITHDNNGNIFVTDFSNKKVFRYQIASGTWDVFVTGLAKQPNGIIFDQPNNRLVMVSWGANAPIMEVALADSSVTQITATTLGSCDGIQRDTAGNYYVSAWTQNALYKFNNSFSAPTSVMTGLHSPADLSYNQADSIGIPNSSTNTVVWYHIPAPNQIVAPQKKTIDVFPSPVLFGDDLMIHSSYGNSTISIFDLTGKKIFSSSFNQELKINSGLFSRGIFFYDVEENNFHLRGKFIVE